MIEWDGARIAAASGATLTRAAGPGPATLTSAAGPGPRRATIDSREVQPGDLFVGLSGQRVEGGTYAAQALRDGAWGVLVAPQHAHDLPAPGAVLTHNDPLVALHGLARAWRRALGAKVVAITGSTGKTSTKDILAALLARDLRTVASPQNRNTEIGLPLAVLEAPPGTAALVLELAMRGPGQIAELVAIAEPDVGVIVNVGPVHLELLGSLEAIAAAKAELIAGLAPGATMIVPAEEPLLAPHLRGDLRTVSFGEGGDVELVEPRRDGEVEPRRDEEVERRHASEVERRHAGEAAPRDGEVVIVEHATAPRDGGAAGDRLMHLRPSFAQSHNLRNLLAAVAAARALGITPAGELEVVFSALRGERIALADGIVLINDCYNANPLSMRAALDDLAACAPERRVAVLGDMLELGPEERRLHDELARHAAARGVELLVAVGPLARGMGEAFHAARRELATRAVHGATHGAGAEHGELRTAAAGEFRAVPDAPAAAELLPELLVANDTVLVKGSRGVGLELIAETLAGKR